MQSSRKFKVKCMYILEIFLMDFGSSQPGLMADFVPDREHFYLKVKTSLSPRKEKNPKRICVWLIWVVWWTRSVASTLEKKNKKKKKGSVKCFVYSHKAASTMPAQLNDRREQPSDLVELHLLVSFLFLDLMSSTGLFIQGLHFVVQKNIVCWEDFLSWQLLCQAQWQSLALGGHELSVGFLQKQ